jgi:hypothetical protein
VETNFLWGGGPIFAQMSVIDHTVELRRRVADPHHITADPDSASHFNADPDPAFHFRPDPDHAPHQSDANLQLLVCKPFVAPFFSLQASIVSGHGPPRLHFCLFNAPECGSGASFQN